ncbi:MAG: SLC13 family permease [Candidatus Acetothermia bacterium]
MNKRLITILVTSLFAYLLTLSPFLSSLEPDARTMIAITFLAAVFWVTECLPISITALLVIFLQGLLGVQPLPEALAYVAHPVNTLLVAGFIIAAALKKYGLDRRVGLRFISLMGEKTENLIFGLMVGTAFLSMWISNTAATAIMLPIGLGILRKADQNPRGTNMGKAMVIGLAFTANIGGMGTPVGTPPVPITIAFLEELADIHISFLGWIIRAVPVVMISLPLVWKLMMTVYEPEIKKIAGGVEGVRKELQEMGNLSRDQIHVWILFGVAIFLWLLDAFGGVVVLPDGWIYLASLIISMMFIFPGLGVIEWEEARNEIGWSVLILVGGGLALGSGLEKTGIIDLIATNLEGLLVGTSLFIIVSVVALVTAFSITLFSSLTATSSTFVPVAIALAFQLGVNPVVLACAAGMSACLAFLLPANTPPNAIVYRTGYFKTYEMTKAGLLSTILCVTVLVFVVMVYWLPLL